MLSCLSIWPTLIVFLLQIVFNQQPVTPIYSIILLHSHILHASRLVMSSSSSAVIIYIGEHSTPLFPSFKIL